MTTDVRDRWTCYFCGESRPEDRISVKTRPLIHGGKVQGEQTQRFCNDKPECRLAAQKWWAAEQ